MLKLYVTFFDLTEPIMRQERFSHYRTEKLGKNRNQKARLQSCYAELLLRYAMNDSGFSVKGPLEIEKGEYGKPYLKTGECCFSLSHSEQAVLCALSDKELGADIQIIRPMNDSLMERYYTSEERDYVRSCDDPDLAYTGIWARKESYIKASGLGLTAPLTSFSVCDPEIADHIWHTVIRRYVLAVYCPDDIPDKVELHEVKPDALLI